MSTGDKYFQENNDRQAIIEYKKAAFLSKSATVYFDLGQIYFLNDQISTAEYYFKKAIGRDKNYINANLGLAELYLAEQKLDQAESVLTKNDRQSGTTDLKEVELSRIYLAQEKSDVALETLKNSDDNLAKFYQAKILVYQQQYEQAQGVLAEISPKEDNSRSLLPKPPSEEQIKVFRDAISQSLKTGNKATRKVIFGEALNQTNDANIALPILKKVAEENPLYRDAQVFLAHSYLITKNFEEGKNILLKAKELDPIYYPTWLYLSEAYQSLGNNEQAKTCLDKANKLK